MKVVWKFDLHRTEVMQMIHDVAMPRGAQILRVELQHGVPVVWALVDPKAELRPRRLAFVMTGEEMTDEYLAGAAYVGTILAAGGDFVLHLFDSGESP